MSLYFEPEWPAPAGVRAATTVRSGGTSRGAYASLNLGDHVGDHAGHVRENRARLRTVLDLPSEPVWLRQVHGKRALDADAPLDREADAGFTARPGVVCAVLTADCLPILLCSRDGTRVAAVHGGWRGLAAGIVQATVAALGTGDWIAWLGPAIGADAFEVGPEVRDAFLSQSSDFASAFQEASSGKWRADLYCIARRILAQLGIDACFGGQFCTYSDPERFFSHRREGQTGRMATLIWRE